MAVARRDKLEKKDIRDPCVKWARRQGWRHVVVDYGGWPDNLFIHEPDLHVWVEFKRPGKTPEPLQAYRHRVLRGLQCRVLVIDSITIFKEKMNEFVQRL